jgi:[ribosomal protein S5]-alanine N-acetyltransferase
LTIDNLCFLEHPMPEILSTPRLLLRPFRLSDAAEAFGWFGDAEVMRYSSLGPDQGLAQTKARVQGYIEHQAHYGYSKWIVVERATSQPVGDSGLMTLPGSDEIELGYRFRRTCWGRGLATEAALAWLQHAFGPLQLPAVIAFANRANAASVRVMQKVGMHFLRFDTLLGIDAVVYCATRMQWNDEQQSKAN